MNQVANVMDEQMPATDTTAASSLAGAGAEPGAGEHEPFAARDVAARRVMPRQVALDGLRAIACLLVYFFHVGFNFQAPPLVLVGSVGVHIFFVLSGFLMFGPFLPALLGEGRPPRLWSYVVRRVTRIYPPFLVSLILFSLARYALKRNSPGGFDLVTHGLLIFNYVDRDSYFGISAIYWSLAIEAQFYVILPLIALPVAKFARGKFAPALVIGAFLVVGLASRYFEATFWSDPAAPSRFTWVFSHLDMFALGMAAAWVVRARGGTLTRSAATRWGLVLGGAAAILATCRWTNVAAEGHWQTGPSTLFLVGAAFALCFGAALIVTAIAAWPNNGPRLLTNRPIVWVGTISYSLYLYHQGVQELVIRVVRYDSLPGELFGLKSFLMGLIALPPTLIVAAVAYYLIEAPAMRWGQRYSQHQPTPMSGAGSRDGKGQSLRLAEGAASGPNESAAAVAP
jgi:peptidoglycan/LPS O-acetylase OafA/YrhL